MTEKKTNTTWFSNEEARTLVLKTKILVHSVIILLLVFFYLFSCQHFTSPCCSTILTAWLSTCVEHYKRTQSTTCMIVSHHHNTNQASYPNTQHNIYKHNIKWKDHLCWDDFQVKSVENSEIMPHFQLFNETKVPRRADCCAAVLPSCRLVCNGIRNIAPSNTTTSLVCVYQEEEAYMCRFFFQRCPTTHMVKRLANRRGWIEANNVRKTHQNTLYLYIVAVYWSDNMAI